MINPSVPRFPAQPISWSDVARVCRRICLLRECDRNDEAERLRSGALADALAAVRTPADTDVTVAQRLEATFAAEAERVANASALAELLAPLMAKQNASSEHARPTRIEEMAGEMPALPAHAASIATPPSPSVPRDPTDISHFIDEMLAQERPPPRGAPVRRAS